MTFLGTNGWYDTETGNTVSVLVETSGAYLVLDAGFGFYKARSYIEQGKPVSLFISHLHLDHLIGLHTLPIFKLRQGIDIYAPKNTIKALRILLRKPFTSSPLTLFTRLRYHALEDTPAAPVEYEYARLQHSVPCHGYRFTADGATIAYCTDTGMCNNLKRLASGADLLLAECAMAPGEKGPNLFHLTPEAAGATARESGAKRLALFHFDPEKYPVLESRRRAEEAAKRIFPYTLAANDGTVLTV